MSQLPPPPPSYEEVMLGRPIEASDVSIPQFNTYNTMHDYIYASSANSTYNGQPVIAPPSSNIPTTYWTQHGLDQLANVREVYVKGRKGDSYHITDMLKKSLYTADLEMETACLCCDVEKGPGITLYLVTATEQKVLKAHRTTVEHCCSELEETIAVTRLPDVNIGAIEGLGSKYSLKNASGDMLCNAERENTECCNCSNSIYQVVPTAMPTNTGSLEVENDGCIVKFPSSCDVVMKGLLIFTSINILFCIEEQRKNSD